MRLHKSRVAQPKKKRLVCQVCVCKRQACSLKQKQALKGLKEKNQSEPMLENGFFPTFKEKQRMKELKERKRSY